MQGILIRESFKDDEILNWVTVSKTEFWQAENHTPCSRWARGEACFLQNKLQRHRYLLALVPFALIVLVFELVPLCTVVLRSFLPEGQFGFTLAHYADIFSKKLYRDAVLNSVLIALFSSIIGIVLAFFGAGAACRAGAGTRRVFMSVLNMSRPWAWPAPGSAGPGTICRWCPCMMAVPGATPVEVADEGQLILFEESVPLAMNRKARR